MEDQLRMETARRRSDDIAECSLVTRSTAMRLFLLVLVFVFGGISLHKFRDITGDVSSTTSLVVMSLICAILIAIYSIAGLVMEYKDLNKQERHYATHLIWIVMFGIFAVILGILDLILSIKDHYQLRKQYVSLCSAQYCTRYPGECHLIYVEGEDGELTVNPYRKSTPDVEGYCLEKFINFIPICGGCLILCAVSLCVDGYCFFKKWRSTILGAPNENNRHQVHQTPPLALRYHSAGGGHVHIA